MIVTVIYPPEVQLSTLVEKGQLRSITFACKAENGRLAFYLKYPDRSVMDAHLKIDLAAIADMRPLAVRVSAGLTKSL